QNAHIEFPVPTCRDVEVGEKIGFFGPGGKWAPETQYEHFVFAGDESAAPAIGAGLARLPEGATATAYIEIESEDRTFDMPTGEGIDIQWVYRNGATHGTRSEERRVGKECRGQRCRGDVK